MMEEMHKHKGVEREDGTLRSHPVSREHKDVKVKRWHGMAIANAKRLAIDKQKKDVDFAKKAIKNNKIIKKAKELEKPVEQPKDVPVQYPTNPVQYPTKKTVIVPVDDDGYLRVDLTKTNHKGLRVQFQRIEGRTRRTVGVQINK